MLCQVVFIKKLGFFAFEHIFLSRLIKSGLFLDKKEFFSYYSVSHAPAPGPENFSTPSRENHITPNKKTNLRRQKHPEKLAYRFSGALLFWCDIRVSRQRYSLLRADSADIA